MKIPIERATSIDTDVIANKNAQISPTQSKNCFEEIWL